MNMENIWSPRWDNLPVWCVKTNLQMWVAYNRPCWCGTYLFGYPFDRFLVTLLSGAVNWHMMNYPDLRSDLIPEPNWNVIFKIKDTAKLILFRSRQCGGKHFMPQFISFWQSTPSWIGSDLCCIKHCTVLDKLVKMGGPTSCHFWLEHVGAHQKAGPSCEVIWR